MVTNTSFVVTLASLVVTNASLVVPNMSLVISIASLVVINASFVVTNTWLWVVRGTSSVEINCLHPGDTHRLRLDETTCACVPNCAEMNVVIHTSVVKPI